MIYFQKMNIQQMLENQLVIREKDFTSKQKIWIRCFIDACPETMELLGKGIQEITSDGKIDLHDIPSIIRMITEIYHNKTIEQEIFDRDHIFLFIQFTLDSLLESKYLLLPEFEKEIIEKMVNSSLELLKYNIPFLLKEKEKCCQGFFSTF